jgi:hypothetical protein
MWKAIINWINSKAYRCEHDWEQVDKVSVVDGDSSKNPWQIKWIYRCTKCCESKTIKT